MKKPAFPNFNLKPFSQLSLFFLSANVFFGCGSPLLFVQPPGPVSEQRSSSGVVLRVYPSSSEALPDEILEEVLPVFVRVENNSENTIRLDPGTSFALLLPSKGISYPPVYAPPFQANPPPLPPPPKANPEDLEPDTISEEANKGSEPSTQATQGQPGSIQDQPKTTQDRPKSAEQNKKENSLPPRESISDNASKSDAKTDPNQDIVSDYYLADTQEKHSPFPGVELIQTRTVRVAPPAGGGFGGGFRPAPAFGGGGRGSYYGGPRRQFYGGPAYHSWGGWGRPWRGAWGGPGYFYGRPLGYRSYYYGWGAGYARWAGWGWPYPGPYVAWGIYAPFFYGSGWPSNDYVTYYEGGAYVEPSLSLEQIMERRALPAMNLAPKQQASGFIYFEKPKDLAPGTQATLIWQAKDEKGQNIAQFSVPVIIDEEE